MLLLGLALGAFLVRGRARGRRPRRRAAAALVRRALGCSRPRASSRSTPCRSCSRACSPPGIRPGSPASSATAAGGRSRSPSRSARARRGAAPARLGVVALARRLGPAPARGIARRGRAPALGRCSLAWRAASRRGRARSSPGVAATVGEPRAPRAPSSHVSKGAQPLRLVAGAAAVAGATALALPGAAAAHGRGATIALDYRLRLDPAADRAAGRPRARARRRPGARGARRRRHRLLVRGLLRRADDPHRRRGVWVNASSPTAKADGLVARARAGWVRIRDGRSLAWHDHRLAPPPREEARRGRALRDPGRGRRARGDDRRHVHPRREAGPVAVARRRDRPCGGDLGSGAAAAVAGALTIGLGVAGGLAALVAVTTFAVRAAPTGGVAWLQLVSGIVVAAALGGTARSTCAAGGVSGGRRRRDRGCGQRQLAARVLARRRRVRRCRRPGRGSRARSRSSAGPRRRRSASCPIDEPVGRSDRR